MTTAIDYVDQVDPGYPDEKILDIVMRLPVDDPFGNGILRLLREKRETILTERERCAKIAETKPESDKSDPDAGEFWGEPEWPSYIGKQIAARIREQK